MHSVEVMRGRRIALPRPVRGMAFIYFAFVELALFVIDNFIPMTAMLGSVLSVLSGGDASIAAWLVVYAILPSGIVWAMSNAEIDGRSPHFWVLSFFRYLKRPKRTLAGRPVRREGTCSTCSGRVRVWWDIGAPRLHHGWISGGKVSIDSGVRFAHALIHRHLTLRPDDDCESLRDYEVEDRLEVKP